MLKVRVKKLKKIKTIYYSISHDHYREKFDNEVNEYLNAGWRMGEIKVIEARGGDMVDVVYARLELWGVIV